MNKVTFPLVAALMLSASTLSVPVVLAQEKDDKPSSMKEGGADRGSPPAASRDSAPDKATSGNQSERSEKNSGGAMKKDAEEKSGDQNKSRRASDQKDRGEKAEAREQDNPKSKSTESKDDKPSAKQSESKSDRPPAKKADTKPEPADKSGESADSKKADDTKREAAGDAAKTGKAKSADLSGDKKDRVKTSFKSESVKEITNVNVDISVGRRLPRDWDYHPVPIAVIEIVPEYRGYRYAYVEDRYVIVDPDTYEVVYVLDDSGGGSVGRSTGESGSARCTTELTFSEEDRTFIIEKVRKTSATIQIGNLEIGAELPQDAKVEVFPAEVTTRVTRLDQCRYIVIDDKVAVVDPTDDKIVAIIED